MMKTLALLAVLLFGINAYAANGDLTVNGTINAGTGGIKFSDGSTQTTAKKLIWDYVVTAPTTSVTSATLDGNADGGYEFEFIFVPGSANAAYFSMYYNNDQTPGNYQVQWVAGTGATAGAASDMTQDKLIAATQTSANNLSVMSGRIYVSPSGKIYATAITKRGNDDSVEVYTQRYATTVANLTRIDIVASVANGIGVNSRFRLWKKIY